MTKIITVTEPVEAREWVHKCPERSPVLAEVELHVFRGGILKVLVTDQGKPLSYNVTRLGKRKKNIWEPYANWYTAYTIERERNRGLATQLAETFKEEAVKFGCVRLKALAGTLAGLMLHNKLKDQFWGITEMMEVVVDTPLVPNQAYNGKRPPNAVTTDTEPWPLERVLNELGDNPLRYETKKLTPRKRREFRFF